MMFQPVYDIPTTKDARRALIIANENFVCGYLSDRVGTEFDVAGLTKMFRDHLKFDVKLKQNLTAQVGCLL